MNAPLVFLDTETTGLDPSRHAVWEVAIIREPALNGSGTEGWSRLLQVDLSTADPGALRINDFYGRYFHGRYPFDLDVPGARSKIESPDEAARKIAYWTAGAHLVGMVPSFDAAFLERLLRRHGYAPAWHYHLVDVEAMVAGKLGLNPPWRSDELSRAEGVQPSDFARHTAMGDVEWCRAIYRALMP